jgi:hypothetical protein
VEWSGGKERSEAEGKWRGTEWSGVVRVSACVFVSCMLSYLAPSAQRSGAVEQRHNVPSQEAICGGRLYGGGTVVHCVCIRSKCACV